MSELRPEYKIDGRPSTIFRTVKDKDNPYVMVDRRPIDNPALSFKAKGILTYLLSRPDGWEVNLVDLANRSIEGLSSIKSGVKELKEAGHLKYIGIRNADGQFGTVIWEVYEAPQVGNQLTDAPYIGVSPQVEKPQADKPQADNHMQVLSTLSINKLNSNGNNDKTQNLKHLKRKNQNIQKLDWMIAGGATSEEVAMVLEKEQQAKEKTDAYEQAMGYNPLTWSGSLERLKRFLLSKPDEEIRKFAAWSKREYSPLSPTQARKNPDLVIDCWLQAFDAEPTMSEHERKLEAAGFYD